MCVCVCLWTISADGSISANFTMHLLVCHPKCMSDNWGGKTRLSIFVYLFTDKRRYTAYIGKIPSFAL